MRRYTEHPEEFRADFETIIEFLKEKGEGKEPTYGDKCMTYMLKLDAEIGYIAAADSYSNVPEPLWVKEGHG
jgi:hypothetical protein